MAVNGVLKANIWLAAVATNGEGAKTGSPSPLVKPAANGQQPTANRPQDETARLRECVCGRQGAAEMAVA